MADARWKSDYNASSSTGLSSASAGNSCQGRRRRIERHLWPFTATTTTTKTFEAISLRLDRASLLRKLEDGSHPLRRRKELVSGLVTWTIHVSRKFGQ
ncbi:hypothetical protein EJ03DRAFT_331888 [Teratosphaeria nubilosa]|uniref:Uncharacterized protein n=1 Tax=Teratosphaeria nubilosa TaxID=161662 RepID=A0A6G1KW53_9PEZI|nr:hypothetical protein EJ03DRAFT_331888 [Teratosphaeria nubilosa]